MEDIFLSGFCCWKFKQIAKFGFGRKNQLSPQCIYIAKSRNFQFWKPCTYLFIGNVFTLVPMAQATLVVMILQPHSIMARVICIPRQSWEFWPLLVLRCRQHSSPVMADVCLLMNRKKGGGCTSAECLSGKARNEANTMIVPVQEGCITAKFIDWWCQQLYQSSILKVLSYLLYPILCTW